MTLIDTHPIPCTRPVCRKCQPSPPPNSPPIPSNPHDAATPDPRTQPLLAHAAYVELVRRHLAEIENAGTAWQRVADWQDPGQMPSHFTPPQPGDDDYDQQTAEAREYLPGAAEAREEWIAARHAGRRHDALTSMVRAMTTAMPRIETIIHAALPVRAKRLEDQHLQRAQVAAEGCCVSCWRDDKTLRRIELQHRSDGPDVPYYKDLCRLCGEMKAAFGALPPVWLVKKRNRSGPKSITTVDVERAVAELAGKSRSKEK